ncbi:MAG TPA: hypothetical protein DDX91_05730 [Ruminococcaceae bacterium]|nr:hypothetical protein [Oscillospiraceae bacterium]
MNNDSYKKYYNENPAGAIENVCDSLDSYIEYAEKRDMAGFTNSANLGVSPLAVDGNPYRVVYYVNTPLAMQENSYYCGPACVYMSIEGIRKHMPSSVKSGIVNSQSKNAAAMGTNSTYGTSEGAIRDRMTAMLDGKRYAMDYKYLNGGGYNFTQDEFITYIKNSLAKNGPVIVLINMPFLKYYANTKYPYTSGHYVVVYECVESTDNVYFSVKDPNNWNNGNLCGSHTITAVNLYSCFTAMSWMK